MDDTQKLEARELVGVILHYNGIPVLVTGTVEAHPGNWPLIDAHKRGDTVVFKAA